MRKIATVVLALLLGASALPAVANPGAGGAVEQFADADWIIMNGDRGTMYFAIGWRFVSEYGVATIGAVGKGTCQRAKTKHGELITCHASGRGKNLGPNEFSFDPALRSASISYKFKGERQRVRWTGRGRVPSFGGVVVGGDGYALASAGVHRGASADARIFGRHLRTKGWMSYAGLGQGAGAFVVTDYGREVTVNPDGTFEYRVEVRR